MESRFLVATEGMINSGQFQPDPGQFRPSRKDRLEPHGRLSRQTETRLDKAEQKQALDLLFFISGLRPFEESARVQQPTCSEEETPGLHVRDFYTLDPGLTGVSSVSSKHPGDEQKRRQDTSDSEKTSFADGSTPPHS